MTDQQILKLLAGIGIGGSIAYLLWPREAAAATSVPALPAPEGEVPVAPVQAQQQPGQSAPIPPPIIRDQLTRTLIESGLNPQLALPTVVAGLSVVHVGTMRPRPSDGQVRRMQRKGLVPPMGSSGVARRGNAGREARQQITRSFQAVIEHQRTIGRPVPGTPVYIVRKALKDLGPNTPKRWKRRFGWEEQWFVGFMPVGGFNSFRANAVQSRNRSLTDIRPVGGIDYGPMQTRQIAFTARVLKLLMERGPESALALIERQQDRATAQTAPVVTMPPPPTSEELEERELIADENAADEAADDDISESDDDIEEQEIEIEAQEQTRSQRNPQAPRNVEGNGGYVYQQHPNGTIKIIRDPTNKATGVTITSGAAWTAITSEIGPHPSSRQVPSGAPRIVSGSGGYKYEQHPNGVIRILKDPSGRATGVTLRPENESQRKAWRAITSEIGPYSVSSTSQRVATGPTRPSREQNPNQPRTIKGHGGWQYLQYPDGSIKITGAPPGSRTGAVVTKSKNKDAWEAITREIGEYPQGSGNYGRHPGRRRRAG